MPEEFQYDAAKARQGIELLAHNADMLEQTSANLDKVRSKMYVPNMDKAFGYKVVRMENGYELQLNDKRIDVREHGNRVYEYHKLIAYANEEIVRKITLADQALKETGLLAHAVHLDHKQLTDAEERLIGYLPDHMDTASRVMKAYIEHTHASPENRDSVIQAKIDIKALAKLTTEYGDLAGHIIHHSRQMVDRQSDLVTESEIAADQQRKFLDGVKMLDRSHAIAHESNPAYRKSHAERISHRKPVDIADHTHDVNGNARLDVDGQPVKYRPREDGGVAQR